MSNLQNLPRTNARLGTVIRIVDNRDESFESFEGMEDAGEASFATLCETHGNYVLHATRKLANDFRTVPEEWCEDCRRIADALDAEETTWEGRAETREEAREACRLAGVTGWATFKVLWRLADEGALRKISNRRGFLLVDFESRVAGIGSTHLIGPSKARKRDRYLGVVYY